MHGTLYYMMMGKLVESAHMFQHIIMLPASVDCSQIVSIV